jgi:uncharacterized protein (DUF924 family)
MRNAAPRDALAVAAFWRAAGYDRWFTKSEIFDAALRARMERLHVAAAAGALDHWDETPTGTLALVFLLDQVPRNLYRGEARAFASDARAIAVATHAVARRFDQRVTRGMRSFFYLPFEHAEDLEAQEVCLELFRRHGDANGLEYAKVHADIIRRFGRFPHRNGVLGRASSESELKFLADGGFAG